jgi:hypothetical protein
MRDAPTKGLALDRAIMLDWTSVEQVCLSARAARKSETG